MLDELVVANLGIIAEARLEPGPGFVVVTGETGAGKTLLLGALRLLCGEVAKREGIGPADDEIRVEARFTTGDEEMVLARRVGVDRSRAYIDGSLSTVRALRAMTSGVVEIVGQHDHLALRESGGARALLDAALPAEGTEALEAYRFAWLAWKEVQRRAAELGEDRRSLERRLETTRFQSDEISAAGILEDEDVDLEATVRKLRNAEALGEHLGLAAVAIGDEGAAARLHAAVRELRQAARVDASLEALTAQADEAGTMISELASEIARSATDVERDPRVLAGVEDRIATLGGLRRKYGDTLADVVAFGVEAAAEAERLSELLTDADRLDEELRESHRHLIAAGARLTAARSEAGARLADGVVMHLSDMGFDDPSVGFEIDPTDPGPEGVDRVVVTFASDASLDERPLSHVASGGELSRLVLALRLAGGAGDADVVAFDEIDAGVGGGTALAVGRKLASLARGSQVLCVTHLPQVAAFADHHIVVARDGSVATVHPVTGEERIDELTRMLAGMPESEKGRDHAAELLAMAAGA